MPKTIKKGLIDSLCTPSYVYLVISTVTIILLMIQNRGNTDVLCAGNFRCNVGSTSLLFLFNFSYIVFWTFVLDSICKAGHKSISWFIVIFPYVLSMVILGVYMLNNDAVYIA